MLNLNILIFYVTIKLGDNYDIVYTLLFLIYLDYV